MDINFMKIALELAKKGIGNVNPNPLVGAIVVKNGEIIGKGYHKYYGGPHAEVYALDEAGENAKDADIYVTLEPCSHYGKTPPCAKKILESGIKRCFIGSLDPNPLVSGNGMNFLKKHGVDVYSNILKDECDSINKIFFKFIKTKIPYLFLKCAITLDGKIATKSGDSKWITNELAREKVQFYRHKFMGIMVGINTVLKDDPRLTARITNGNNPFRIVVDPNLRITKDAYIIKNNSDFKTIIVTSETNKNSVFQKKLSEESKVQFIYLPNTKFLVNDILKSIGELNIDSILLEGGETLISQVFNEKLIDAGEIFISNKILGDSNAIPFIGGFTKETISESFVLENIRYNLYDNNIGLEFEY